MVTIFEQGDIVYLDFDPQSGHEQKGRRPALVVSNDLFNRVSSLTMVCPITHTDRGHPFHLRLDERTRTDGVILCDQARMLDLSSEVGELAKEVLKSTAYGTKPFTPTASLEEELGDCLFSLLCLSQCLGLEGEAALGKALEKYEKRFAERGTIGHQT